MHELILETPRGTHSSNCQTSEESVREFGSCKSCQYKVFNTPLNIRRGPSGSFAISLLPLSEKLSSCRSTSLGGGGNKLHVMIVVISLGSCTHRNRWYLYKIKRLKLHNCYLIYLSEAHYIPSCKHALQIRFLNYSSKELWNQIAFTSHLILKLIVG